MNLSGPGGSAPPGGEVGLKRARRITPAGWRGMRCAGRVLFLVIGLCLWSSPEIVAGPLRFPLEDYPVDDDCGPWGFLNPNFTRCGLPGKHVADDACAPEGTPVLAIAAGRVTFAGEVGNCTNNWGWLTVMEHALDDGTTFCAIYGHCQPVPGLRPGLHMAQGQQIATVNWPCGGHHIHFGIALGAWGTGDGGYPDWLLGYLPDGTTCGEYPLGFPGRYVDPVAFVQATVPVASTTWGGIKALAR